MNRRALALLAALSLVSAAPAQVTFQFDYSLDSGGFFTGGNSSRQTYLEAAGSYITNLISGTNFSTIAPTGGDTWTPTIFHPGTGANHLLPADPTIAANKILVYAGGFDLDGGTLGIGGAGGFDNAGGSTEFANALLYRDVGTTRMPWGGSIAFDTPTSWYFDTNITNHVGEFSSGQFDFFTVAVHELLHLIGYGGITWDTKVSGSTFTGAASMALNTVNPGNPVSLSTPDLAHWADDTMSVILGTSTLQETVMSPSLANEERRYMTALDLAGLQDIGYLTAIPEPSAYAVIFGSLALVVVYRRRRAA